MDVEDAEDDEMMGDEEVMFRDQILKIAAEGRRRSGCFSVNADETVAWMISELQSAKEAYLLDLKESGQ